MSDSTIRAGTLEPFTDAATGKVFYRGRVRLKDSSRVRVEIPESMKFDEKKSRRHLALAQAIEDKTHEIYNRKIAQQTAPNGKTESIEIVARTPVETLDAFYKRFLQHRKETVSNTDDDAWRWHKWIASTMVRGGARRFGDLGVREVSADDVEDVRDRLTAAVIAYEKGGNEKGEGRLAPKTAANVWAALTMPMKFASTRKGTRELRVREDLGNPCHEMPPPRRGSSKKRHWLRPNQFVKMIKCKRVTRPWREAYAIGLYLHLRPGELHELRIKDLDLAHSEVRISRAYDERERKVVLPKTVAGIRTVSIPRTLAPLLERIAKSGEPEDRVCPVVALTPEKERAGIYREFLQAADVDFPAFYVETATHLQIDFRSLRDSGITWRFLRGDRGEDVQREAGHEHISTTVAYAKELNDRGDGRYGEPFPPLPDDLLGPVVTSAVTSKVATQKRRENGSGRRDLNPRRQAPKACALPGCATPRRRHFPSTPEARRTLPRFGR